jgi:hypothetical protein
MHVDKAGCDCPTVGVYLAFAFAADVAYGRDSSSRDSDIAIEPWVACAIDDFAIPNHAIELGGFKTKDQAGKPGEQAQNCGVSAQSKRTRGGHLHFFVSFAAIFLASIEPN